jgi:AcrR family transcriptional regulator
VAKRARYHHGNLKPALVRAALQLIGKRGADAWTLREVARRAGVSHAAPYRHFRNKEALLAEVAEQGFVALTERIDAAQAKEREPLARLEVQGGVLLGFALDESPRYRVMFGPHAPARADFPSLAAAAAQVFSRLQAGVEACQAARVLRPDVSPVVMSVTFWTSIHGLADLLLNHQLSAFDEQPKNARALGARVARLVYEGLAK